MRVADGRWSCQRTPRRSKSLSADSSEATCSEGVTERSWTTGFRSRIPGMEAVSADAGIVQREQDRSYGLLTILKPRFARTVAAVFLPDTPPLKFLGREPSG